MVLSGSVHARRQSCICIPLVAAHHLAGAHCPRLMMEILVGEVPRLAIKERVEHLVDEWDGRRVVNGRCTPSHNGFKSPALKAWVAVIGSTAIPHTAHALDNGLALCIGHTRRRWPVTCTTVAWAGPLRRDHTLRNFYVSLCCVCCPLAHLACVT